MHNLRENFDKVFPIIQALLKNVLKMNRMSTIDPLNWDQYL